MNELLLQLYKLVSDELSDAIEEAEECEEAEAELDKSIENNAHMFSEEEISEMFAELNEFGLNCVILGEKVDMLKESVEKIQDMISDFDNYGITD